MQSPHVKYADRCIHNLLSDVFGENKTVASVLSTKFCPPSSVHRYSKTLVCLPSDAPLTCTTSALSLVLLSGSYCPYYLFPVPLVPITCFRFLLSLSLVSGSYCLYHLFPVPTVLITCFRFLLSLLLVSGSYCSYHWFPVPAVPITFFRFLLSLSLVSGSYCSDY